MAGLIAVTYNETPDYVYATYISSMWVWLGAAYVVVNIIRLVHGSASIWLVGNYFIVVCVIQCVMALWIDSSVELKQAIDSVIEQGQDFLNSYKVERLYVSVQPRCGGKSFCCRLGSAGFFSFGVAALQNPGRAESLFCSRTVSFGRVSIHHDAVVAVIDGLLHRNRIGDAAVVIGDAIDRIRFASYRHR